MQIIQRVLIGFANYISASVAYGYDDVDNE